MHVEMLTQWSTSICSVTAYLSNWLVYVAADQLEQHIFAGALLWVFGSITFPFWLWCVIGEPPSEEMRALRDSVRKKAHNFRQSFTETSSLKSAPPAAHQRGTGDTSVPHSPSCDPSAVIRHANVGGRTRSAQVRH